MWLATNYCDKRLRGPLLDKVMSQCQWHIAVPQLHLMFKGQWRAPHKTIYGHKKKVCLDKTFPLGHFMLHFIMFLICQMTTKASNEKVSNLGIPPQKQLILVDLGGSRHGPCFFQFHGVLMKNTQIISWCLPWQILYLRLFAHWITNDTLMLHLCE